MKKYTSLFFCGVCGLAMALLLCGCFPAVLLAQSVPDEDLEKEMEDKWEDVWNDEWDGLSDDWNAKGHYWKVLDPDGEEVYTIHQEEAVAKIDELVEGDMDWERVSSVEDKSPLYVYVYMQEKTLLAGQDPEAEREYKEIIRFTVYEDTDVMKMTILDEFMEELSSPFVDLEDILTICTKAPSETVEALRDPTQFSE